MSTRLQIDDRACDAPRGQSVFEAAEQAGVAIPTSCRKNGRCKECVVEVVEGLERLSPRDAAEAHLEGRYRLSCCARIATGTGRVHCRTLRRGAIRIERHADALPTRPRPRAFDPAVTREGDRVLLEGVEIDRFTGALHGLAIDLGTTTVVLRLLDLQSGTVVAEAAFENPQRFGGSDVMARIHYDSHDRTHVLRRTLLGYLTHSIAQLPIGPRSIYEVVIAGNSTMRDMFFGLSVHSIGQSPYQSVTELDVAAGRRSTTSLSETAARLGLPVHPNARVHGLPVISGHVGADAAACLLAVDLAHEDRTVAIMDVGTNTELIVGNRHRILATSCPAGPAFEGGPIAFGMPALPGAIERVAIGTDGSVATDVIGQAMPAGLCGSGLVDLVSELLRTKRINALGRFEDGSPEFVVDAQARPPITFNEADLNLLAQAKGANAAGLRIAIAEFGIAFSELAVFYLAGGFGRHLNVDAARRIGLIPNLDARRIVQIGNASLEGACIALRSRTERAELEALVRRVTHCRLETHPHFFDAFVEGCQFGPVETQVERPAS